MYLNARAYFSDNRRRTALSTDAGRTFAEEGVDPAIFEVNQGTCAGMVRYPPKLIGGADLVLFSNPDAKESVRCHGVLRGSRNGGRTWAYTKDLNSTSDWFDYSSVAVAHDGTILVMAKSTANGRGVPGFAKACSMVRVPRQRGMVDGGRDVDECGRDGHAVDGGCLGTRPSERECSHRLRIPQDPGENGGQDNESLPFAP